MSDSETCAGCMHRDIWRRLHVGPIELAYCENPDKPRGLVEMDYRCDLFEPNYPARKHNLQDNSQVHGLSQATNKPDKTPTD